MQWQLRPAFIGDRSLNPHSFTRSTSKLAVKRWRIAVASPRSSGVRQSGRVLRRRLPAPPSRHPAAASRSRTHPALVLCPRPKSCASESRVRANSTRLLVHSSTLLLSHFVAEAAAFFAKDFKSDAGPKAPSPFSVLVSAAIKGSDQKIFRHHDSSVGAEDIILLFDLLAGLLASCIQLVFCKCERLIRRSLTRLQLQSVAPPWKLWI